VSSRAARMCATRVGVGRGGARTTTRAALPDHLSDGQVFFPVTQVLCRVQLATTARSLPVPGKLRAQGAVTMIWSRRDLGNARRRWRTRSARKRYHPCDRPEESWEDAARVARRRKSEVRLHVSTCGRWRSVCWLRDGKKGPMPHRNPRGGWAGRREVTAKAGGAVVGNDDENDRQRQAVRDERAGALRSPDKDPARCGWHLTDAGRRWSISVHTAEVPASARRGPNAPTPCTDSQVAQGVRARAGSDREKFRARDPRFPPGADAGLEDYMATRWQVALW